MNRKIKFRCWFPKGTDTGGGEIEKGEMCYALAFEEYEPINDLLAGVEHLMQFAGLKDNKGKEMYEGDIVKLNEGEISKIEFRDGCFGVEVSEESNTENGLDCYEVFVTFNDWHKKDPFNDYSDWKNPKYAVEVIGNIYENPELLGE